MNFIITNNKQKFEKIGNYNYCNLEDVVFPKKIAVDTETTGLTFYNCDMFCIQIGTGKNNYIIDLESIEFKDVIPYIENRTLVFVNAVFDLKFFYKHGFYPNDVRDAMIASQILYNGDETVYSHNFKVMMQRELEIVYDKTERKNIHIVKLNSPNL